MEMTAQMKFSIDLQLKILIQIMLHPLGKNQVTTTTNKIQYCL
jgi:hypothetical protein